MRVTKIIREYVENTIRANYDEKINALKNREKTEGEKNYEKWVAETVERLIEEAAIKTKECNIMFHVSTWDLTCGDFKGLTGEALENKKIEKGFESMATCLRNTLEGGSKLRLQSEETVELNEKISELRKECEDKIQEILVGLEIGDINKKELDDALAPFKSGE